MRVFILGAGAVGGMLAQLLHRRGHEVWCGDRDVKRARAFLGENIDCLPANARNPDSVKRAARGCELFVNAAPAAYNETALQAALGLRANYLDMASHLERDPFRAEQLRFHKSFESAGHLALINAGAAPGLTNLLAALAAEEMEEVIRVRIRLFEDIEGRGPVSTWSSEVAFDEAVSRPRVYRRGRFRLARRFDEEEWFRFPPPIGEVRVVLVAQDEAATLPHFIRLKDLDVKAGGADIERLRRWHRKGKLRPSGGKSEKRFPATAAPGEILGLMHRRKLDNARFAVAVAVTGKTGGGWVEQRDSCLFPTLNQLRRKRLFAAPVAYAAAECAAAFIHRWPGEAAGVLPPEALSTAVLRVVLDDLRRKKMRVVRKTIPIGPEPPERG